MRKRDDVSVTEWLHEIQTRPEEVAKLLQYESRFGNLWVMKDGQVWNGGYGAGYGTGFRMQPAPPGTSEGAESGNPVTDERTEK